ncbi:MAG: tetratricopeptide repeat protein [Planctomycetota bacterium]
MRLESNSILAAFLVLTACAGTPEPVSDAPVVDASASTLTTTWPVTVEASAPVTTTASQPTATSPEQVEDAVAPATTGQRTPDRTALDVAYFNTEEWKKRFAQSFLSVSDVEPTMTETEAEELQEILKLISEGKKDRALGRLQLANNEAASASFPFLIAQLHIEENREEEALAMIDVTLERFDRFRRAWNSKALIHYQRGEFDEATPAFAKALSLGQVDEITYGLMAVCLANDEKFIAAETAFRQALMLAPDSTEWRQGIARCLVQQERYPEAIALYSSLIDENPENPTYWLIQGNAFLGQGEFRSAAENFQMADQLGGSTNASLNLLGDIYTNDGLDGLAVEAYLAALEKDENAKPDRVLAAAALMTARGETESATSLLDGVDGHFGETLPEVTQAELLKLRAKIAVREGRGADEISILEEIVANDPLDGDALILLGESLERAGRPEEAYLKLDTAARIEGFEARANVRHAQLLVREGRYDEAIPLIKASLEIEDDESVRSFLEGVEKAARRSSK